MSAACSRPEDGLMGSSEDVDGAPRDPRLHLCDEWPHHLSPHAARLHLPVALQSAAVPQDCHQPRIRTLVS